MDKIKSKRSPSTVVISLDVSISLVLIYAYAKKHSLRSTKRAAEPVIAVLILRREAAARGHAGNLDLMPPRTAA